MRKCFTILALLIFSNLVIGQNKLIDSLINILPATTSDTAKIDILCELSYLYYPIDLKKTYEYSQQALDQAEAIGYERGVASALLNRSIAVSIEGDHLEAIQMESKALEIVEAIRDTALIAKCYNSIGINYDKIGQMDRAMDYYYKSIAYSKGRNPKLYCLTLGNLAYLHSVKGEDDKALKNMELAQKVAESSEHPFIKGVPEHSLGVFYLEKENYEKAQEYLEKAISHRGFARNMALFSMIELYVKQGNYEKALDYCEETVENMEDAGHMDLVFRSKVRQAQILLKMNRSKESLEVANSIEDKKGANFGELVDFYRLKIKLLMKAKKTKEANIAYEKLVELQDSLYNENKLNITYEMEAKYKIANQEHENEMLRANKEKDELAIAHSKRNLWFLIALVALMATVSTLLWKGYRANKNFNLMLQQEVEEKTRELTSTNKDLLNSNMELERFAYIASHDLKTPLNNIISFSYLLEKEMKNYDNPKAKQYLTFVKNGGIKMNNLIKDVLEFSNLSAEKGMQEVDLNQMVGEIKETISEYIASQNAQVLIKNNLPAIIANESRIFLLFKNLIENGIKYNESNVKTVEIYSREGLDDFFVFIKDNGIGIELEYRDKIFEMFARLHRSDEYEGTGLGLSICKKIMESLNGELRVESKKGLGSTFILKFQKGLLTTNVEIEQLENVIVTNY